MKMGKLFVGSVWELKMREHLMKTGNQTSSYAHVNVQGPWVSSIFLALKNGLMGRDLSIKGERYNHFSGKPWSVSSAMKLLKIG